MKVIGIREVHNVEQYWNTKYRECIVRKCLSFTFFFKVLMSWFDRAAETK
jgi:hypothetical protein